MNKVRRRLERRAYAAIEREGEALGRLGQIQRTTRCAGSKPNANCRARGASVPRPLSDSMSSEAAMDTLRGALECVDIKTGELHRPEHVQALIEGVVARSGGVREAREVAQPGAGVQKSVLPRLEALAEPWSAQAVSLACICWYLVRELHRPAHARRRALSRHLLGAYGALQDRLGPESASLDAIDSSAIECGTTPLSLRPQGRHSGLSRPVPRRGSICARGAGDGTRGPALTSA